MRWLGLVVLLTACNAGGLAPPDARVGDDDVPIDAAHGIDAARFDAALFDAPLIDAAFVEIPDAEIHDAEVPPDAEIHDAEPEPDAHDPLVDSLTVTQTGFAGSITVAPTGTSCGPGCNQYAAPTDVVITLHPLVGGAIGWLPGPCQFQGSQPTCTVHVAGEVIVPAVFYCPTFVVDIVTGDDTNPGTCGAPFKTITKAAGLAHGFQIISVAPGAYTSATETFPIVIPEGTPVWGDYLNRGAAVTIGGPVVLTEGAELAGVTISNPGGTAITASFASKIRANVVRDSAIGIAVGVAGVIFENVEPICNGVDVAVADGVSASAVGCTWDHDPPTAADVSLGVGAALDVSSSSLSEAACP